MRRSWTASVSALLVAGALSLPLLASATSAATSKQWELGGVSCVSAKACTAVGVVGNSTLAEAWNGKKWAVEATPPPYKAKSSSLSGVSCTSAKACTAVGEYVYGVETGVTLAEAWNGKKWTNEHASSPNGAKESSLSAVSCASASACTAVGQYVDKSGTTLTLAEAWNGKKWTIEPTPNPTGAFGSFLSAVSCSSAKACTAVGDTNVIIASFFETLTEAWNGKKWAIEQSFNGATDSSFEAVACKSVVACTAVGYYYLSVNPILLTLAEAWNGKKWTVEPTSNPTGSKDSYLSGVSCTSATACRAVGYSENSAHTALTLAEAWNGKKWTIERTPNPTGSKDSYLSAMSCSSAVACVALGYYVDARTPLTLAEMWNGRNWTIEPTPNPTGSS